MASFLSSERMVTSVVGRRRKPQKRLRFRRKGLFAMRAIAMVRGNAISPVPHRNVTRIWTKDWLHRLLFFRSVECLDCLKRPVCQKRIR